MKHLYCFTIFSFLCFDLLSQDITFEAPISLFEYSTELEGFNNPLLPLDYNSDGNTDFYYADRFDGDLIIFKGLGNDQFEKIDIPQIAYDPLKAIDFDQDGDLDIINEKHIFLTEPSDSFTIFKPSVRGIIIEVEDFDNDGLMDILTHTNIGDVFNDEQIVMYFNNGDNSFTEEILSTGFEYHDIDLGDIDGDGDLDLVGTIRYEDEPVLILRNTGIGFDEERTSYNFSSPKSQCYLRDLDRDGDLDFITNDNSSGFHVIENVDGFQSASTIKKVSTQQVLVFNMTDLNGDGLQDIIRFGSNSTKIKIEVMIGLENLDFSENILLAEFDRIGAFSYPNSNYTATNLSLYDYDNDGLKDLLFSNGWEEPSKELYFRNISELSNTENQIGIGISNIVVAPNPTSDYIQIFQNERLLSDEVSYKIINSNGSTIQTRAILKGHINVKHLPTGMYYIQFNDEKSSCQFIKK